MVSDLQKRNVYADRLKTSETRQGEVEGSGSGMLFRHREALPADCPGQVLLTTMGSGSCGDGALEGHH
jgi:hypothetical protein